ncbi:hypothetical protein GOV11_00145 [Candidatus Woesearchaeota archaeon]|nr:hypothetical protein [Candidatus Woesearchaeota archaeon]
MRKAETAISPMMLAILAAAFIIFGVIIMIAWYQGGTAPFLEKISNMLSGRG